MKTLERVAIQDRIRKHGENLLAIFPNATERDPVKLCKKLRRLEADGQRIALRMCNGPEYAEDEAEKACDAVLAKVNKLLGNEQQTKIGAPCSCKRGQQRDNCPACEGTGRMIDFKALRAVVPVRLNRDPRGYALKIDDAWMREHNVALHRDWGGYGIIAPDLTEDA